VSTRRRKPKAKRPLRIVTLVHPELVPPDSVEDPSTGPAAPWKTEYDVVSTLRALGHEVKVLGVGGDLEKLRKELADFQPALAFNLVEGFDEDVHYDYGVVLFLELMHVKYTGCNPKGLLLARDKALAKKLLSYHRVAVPDFVIAPKGRKFRRPKRLAFPLIVKSLTMDASIGISQASVVDDDEKLAERIRFIHESVRTDALVEEFIDGRELYVGVMGHRVTKTLPVWELLFTNMPEESRRIATERLKWSLTYQKKHGIVSGEAKDLAPEKLEEIARVARRAYRTLCLTGYARIDLRLAADGKPYVIEANPNPQLSRDEDFAQSALKAGFDYEGLIQRIVDLGTRWEPPRWV
jgi:D-alanine-D-alanine ligase